MLKIEHTEVHGFEPAIRGMRNPMNSWDKSDSYWTHIEDSETLQTANFEYFIGENDLKLGKTLAEAGTDHGKWLRFVQCYCDITAPLYWHKEMDTYRAGVEKNSCSTMHKIHAKEFTLDDFSHELLTDHDEQFSNVDMLWHIIKGLNKDRAKYLETKDRVYWDQLIQMLPSSYNQRRTYMFSYAALKNIYHARKNHKLAEWHVFCDWVRTLPYSEMITGDE